MHDELEFDEVAAAALAWAAENRPTPDTPMTTGLVLSALAQVDTRGEWERLWLHTGDPQALDLMRALDPRSASSLASWRGIPASPELAEAFGFLESARDAYGYGTIPPGLLALACVIYPDSGAARRLGQAGISHERLVAVVQDDLLESTLEGLAALAALRPLGGSRTLRTTGAEELDRLGLEAGGGSAAGPTHIRVFVSSTFADLVAERDHLARFTFPALAQFCQERGTQFSSIDLRWGVTEEQADAGGALGVCLGEIDRCRPYFLGILGDRYGWVPQQISPETLALNPWLDREVGRSITELEMVHGALGDHVAPARAFFYEREPDSEQVSPPADLEALKARIRAAGYEIRLFSDRLELDSLIRRDLELAVTFALSDRTDTGDESEATRHLNALRAAGSGFVPRPALRAAISDALERSSAVVVTGEPGSGKTAVLGDMFGESSDEVLVHSCAAQGASDEWIPAARTLGRLLASRYAVQFDDVANPALLRASLANALESAGQRRQVTVVIDGAERLRDDSGGTGLSFLPDVPPSGCRFVITATSNSQVALQLARRGWEHVLVPDLSQGERPAVLKAMLSELGKTATEGQCDIAAGAAGAASPLFLRLATQELSVIADHSGMMDHFTALMGAAGVPELLDLILARWECDFAEPAGLVRDVLTNLVVSREGLTDSELAAFVASGPTPVPVARIAPIIAAAGPTLMPPGELLRIGLPQFRTAIRTRYLAGRGDSARAARVLADYFLALDPQVHGTRASDEVPWLLLQGGQLDELVSLVSRPAVVLTLLERSETNLVRLWGRLRAEGIQPGPVYEAAIADPATTAEQLSALSLLLDDLGMSDLYITAAEAAAGASAKAASGPERDRALFERTLLAVDPKGLGDPRAHMQTFTSIRSRALARGDVELATMAILGIANCYLQARNFKMAQSVLRNAESEARRIPAPGLASQAAGMLASAKGLAGQPVIEALPDLQRSLRWARESGDETRIGAALVGLATANSLAGLATHDNLLVEAERLSMMQEDPEPKLHAIVARANAALDAGDEIGALGHLEEAARLARELGRDDVLIVSLKMQALLLENAVPRARRIELLREAAALSELGSPADRADVAMGLVTFGFDEADDLAASGRSDRASELRDFVVSVAGTCGNDEIHTVALIAQAQAVEEERPDRALELLSQAETLARGSRGRPARENLALILLARGRLLAGMGGQVEAAGVLDEASRLFAKLSDASGTTHVHKIRSQLTGVPAGARSCSPSNMLRDARKGVIGAVVLALATAAAFFLNAKSNGSAFGGYVGLALGGAVAGRLALRAMGRYRTARGVAEPVAHATDPLLAAELEGALGRADAWAAQEGFHESTVGHVVRAILGEAAEDEDSTLSQVLWVIHDDSLEPAPGTTILQARMQKERVLEAARAYAAVIGSHAVTPSHYVVAAALLVGDQMPGLDGHRMAVARMAGLQVVGPAWVVRGHLWRAQARAVALNVTSDFFRQSGWRRVVASVFKTVREFALRYRSQMEALTLLPGVVVRESLWAGLAWVHRCNRRAFSFLGVPSRSGLTRVVDTRTRVRIECYISVICFTLGIVALAAYLAPTRLLGVTGDAAMDLQSEESFVMTSALSAVGVLGLGPWVAWALLAVSTPTWEQANRMRWSAQMGGAGRLTRLLLWVLHGLGSLTWPVEALVSRLGLLGVLARALPVILISTVAMDRLI